MEINRVRRSILYNIFAAEKAQPSQPIPHLVESDSTSYDPLHERKMSFHNEFRQFLDSSKDVQRLEHFTSDALDENELKQVLEFDLLESQYLKFESSATSEIKKALSFQRLQYDKMIAAIRLSNITGIENLHTRYKCLLKDLVIDKCIRLRDLFEKECQELMKSFFELKSQIVEKDTKIKTMELLVVNLELGIQEGNRRTSIIKESLAKQQKRQSIVLEDKIQTHIIENQKLRQENERLLDMVEGLELQMKLFRKRESAAIEAQQQLQKFQQLGENHKHVLEKYENTIRNLKNQLRLATILKDNKHESFGEDPNQQRSLRHQLNKLKHSFSVQANAKDEKIKELEAEIEQLKIINLQPSQQVKLSQSQEQQQQQVVHHVRTKQSLIFFLDREISPVMNKLNDFILHPPKHHCNLDYYYESPKYAKPIFDVYQARHFMDTETRYESIRKAAKSTDRVQEPLRTRTEQGEQRMGFKPRMFKSATKSYRSQSMTSKYSSPQRKQNLLMLTNSGPNYNLASR